MLMNILKTSKLQEDLPDSTANYSRKIFTGIIETLSRDEFNKLAHYLVSLEHHKATTENLFAMDQDPRQLLHRFWQRTSDACPLEAGEAEEQEKYFEGFVNDLTWTIKFVAPQDVQDLKEPLDPLGNPESR